MTHGTVVFDPQRNLLIGTVEDGPTFEEVDAAVLAERMYAAGARHGQVSMPDWREGDTAPCTGDKIAFHSKLNQLGRGI